MHWSPLGKRRPNCTAGVVLCDVIGNCIMVTSHFCGISLGKYLILIVVSNRTEASFIGSIVIKPLIK